jgi:hypothetical protein
VTNTTPPQASPLADNSDRFSKLASGIQSIVTATGIIVGGAWVLFTFWDLGVAERSRAEIAEIDQRSVEQPVLSVDIKWATFGETVDKKHLVSFTAIFKNVGKRAVEFGDTEAKIIPLSESGIPNMDASLNVKPLIFDYNKQKLVDAANRALRSGQARTVAFFLPSFMPGMYFIQLRSTYGGLILKNGNLERSSDQLIEAIEQSIVNVPAGISGLSGKSSALYQVLQPAVYKEAL